ncbi:MAG: hypothetical protein WC229_02555 [Candidatus Paceibacterota bacterium]|jgi:hypothetical protein
MKLGQLIKKIKIKPYWIVSIAISGLIAWGIISSVHNLNSFVRTHESGAKQNVSKWINDMGKSKVFKSKKKTEVETPNVVVPEKGWVWKSFADNKEHSFRVKFIQKNDTVMEMALLAPSGLEIARVKVRQPGEFGWSWYGEWINPPNNNSGQIVLKELEGSNGRIYIGYQSDGNRSRNFVEKTIIEFVE